VESSVGSGSVFWFELGTAEAPLLAAEKNGFRATAQAQTLSDAAPRTLLYVEDNTANLKLVEQLIARRPDLRLLSAGNGLLGIDLAWEFQPSVILMDINLPGISGLEALERLRQDPATAHIPVLAVSANAMAGDIRKCLDAGFFRYITKPIKVNELMEMVDLALAFAERDRPTAAKGL
jgi:CheY-like chemotaxis protein